jgi:uncharacterized protein
MKVNLFCLLITIFTMVNVNGQDQEYTRKIEEHRAERNREMRDTASTPLKADELKKFTALNFYAPDPAYCVKAKFTKTRKKEEIKMNTSSKKIKNYYVYAVVDFTLAGKAYRLNVYQSLDLMKKKEYKDYLFIPFTDQTNGNETYGGGRYIDLRIPKSNTITLDFNLCYNPYCAYTTGYNCPIPPQENYLDTEIKAGEKKLWDDH